MRHLEISLGKACDNRCVFCATGRESRGDRGWMAPDVVGAALAEARANGVSSVGFLGGEPLRYPHLVDVVGAARDLGFERVALCTNGRRLSDPARLEALLAAGISRVALSIHSHRAELEDRITGRPGAFAEKLAAIDLLVAAAGASRLPHGLALNVVLHAQNLAHLGALSAFFGRRGVRDLRFNFVRPEVAPEEARRWVPTFARTTPRLRQLLERNEGRLGLQISFADVPLCRLPWELLAGPALRARYLGEGLDADTEVTMHRPPEKGEAKRFRWQEQRAGALKTHLPVCVRCPLRRRCEGPWRGYVALYGDAEFADGPDLARAWVDSPRRRG